jgi:hypothetical protein
MSWTRALAVVRVKPVGRQVLAQPGRLCTRIECVTQTPPVFIGYISRLPLSHIQNPLMDRIIPCAIPY